MTIKPDIFRRYDIRGVIPDDLDEAGAERIGQAFVQALSPKEVIVGRDVRLTGEALQNALVRGLTRAGASAIEIGIVSSDAFYFACGEKKLPGLMVTASHNPPEYNGFKMVRQIPELLTSDELQKATDLNPPTDATTPGTVSHEDVTNAFIKRMLEIVPPDRIKPLKVVVDTSNGSQGAYWKKLEKYLPITLIPQFFEPDGNFPNHENDVIQEAAQAPLRERVVKEKANLGLIFDPDGDRCLAVDDRGKTVPGDFLTALLAETMLKRQPGSAIVYDIRASDAVPDHIRQAGGKPIPWKIGHALIKPKMVEEDAVFGGEVSGHFYFKDFWFVDCGLLAGLTLLEYVSELDAPLSTKLVDLQKKYHLSGEINSVVDNHEAVLAKIKEQYNDGELSELDGIDIRYPDWHFVVRTGANPPGILRLTLEANSNELMEAKRDELLKSIRS
ncbi:phosphomannomutase/phosphoglucomutase [Patescibacteria group bacterium]|nr:phosphomannomutase/phosphoglucomutase [Patescibacteria group bacterium]